jgi:peptidoglycan/LPS O-acetylase OafA/YrhL
MTNPTRRQVTTSLRIIRIAFTGSVLGFAAIATQVVDRQALAVDAAAHASTVRWINVALLAAAAAGILLIQRRHEREPDPQRRQALNVMAWAAGETTAFFGIVHWMMLGDPLPFYVGLGMMLLAFVLVPIRESAREGDLPT